MNGVETKYELPLKQQKKMNIKSKKWVKQIVLKGNFYAPKWIPLEISQIYPENIQMNVQTTPQMAKRESPPQLIKTEENKS